MSDKIFSSTLALKCSAETVKRYHLCFQRKMPSKLITLSIANLGYLWLTVEPVDKLKGLNCNCSPVCPLNQALYGVTVAR